MNRPSTFAVALTMAACLPCRSEGIPCWVRCRKPPLIRNAVDAESHLRTISNPRLSLLARSSGLLTTYLGKMLGIQGWRNYHMDAQVNGTVVHAAGSDDGFYTVDIAISSLTVGGIDAPRAGGRFIRVETLPWVRPGAPLPLGAKDSVCILGGLWWDADGFLEIHPRRSAEIAKHPCL